MRQGLTVGGGSLPGGASAAMFMFLFSPRPEISGSYRKNLRLL
jgi:hypothetical protein